MNQRGNLLNWTLSLAETLAFGTNGSLHTGSFREGVTGISGVVVTATTFAAVSSANISESSAVIYFNSTAAGLTVNNAYCVIVHWTAESEL